MRNISVPMDGCPGDGRCQRLPLARLRHLRRWSPIVLLGLVACGHAPPLADHAASLLQDHTLTPTLATSPPIERTDDGAWWETMGGAPLQQLVLKGLRSNTDIGIALTHVNEARAGLRARDSALSPSLALNGNYQNTHSGLPEPVKQVRPDTRVWQGALQLDWELDVFGRNQAQSDAARQDALRSEAGVAGARLMLITEIARQFMRHEGARRKVALLDEIIALRTESQRHLSQLAQQGEASALQVASGLSELHDLRAQRPSLLTLQAATLAHLAKLTSQSPAEVSDVLARGNASSMTWRTPEPAPTGQPVELLARRPDIMAARSAWRAELARLDSAKADMLPRFFLSLLTGRQDLKLNALDLAAVGFRQTAAVFTLPLFNAGRLQAAVDIQDAAAQRAELQYEQAVRQAADDVESALVQFQQARERVHTLDLSAQARQDAATRGKRLLDEGQIARSEWLALQQAQASAAFTCVDAQEFARLSLVQLHQALGGGWQNAPAHALEIAHQQVRP